MLVLLALLLIFCYLLWVVLPLFRAPAVGVVTDLAAYSAPAANVVPPLSLAAPELPSAARVPLAAAQASPSAARVAPTAAPVLPSGVPPSSSPPSAWSRDDAESALLTLGIDANAGWAWAIDRAGQGITRSVNGAQDAAPVPLLAQPTLVAAASGGQPLYWLTDALGQGVLAHVDSAAGGAPVWLLPFGGAQTIDPARRPLRRIALAYSDADRAVAAAQLADGSVVVLNYTSNSSAAPNSSATPTPTLSVTSALNLTTSAAVGAGAVQCLYLTSPGQEVDRLLLSPDGHLLYVLSSSQLSIWRLDAGGARLRQQVALAAAGPLSLFILPAEGALLVRNGAGQLSLWFDVAGDTGPRLTPIFTYNVTLDAGAPGRLCRARFCRDVNLV
ncbi:hypothetical protein [Sodalis sp.]|uniref:hypothetical protein n=1 Tax=Sodalis sp. (in: enterobacteria) TaxID=1898979 RepID=UPI0038732718